MERTRKELLRRLCLGEEEQVEEVDAEEDEGRNEEELEEIINNIESHRSHETCNGGDDQLGDDRCLRVCFHSPDEDQGGEQEVDSPEHVDLLR